VARRMSSSFMSGTFRHSVTISASLGSGDRSSAVFDSPTSDAHEMMVLMAEAKRDLIWIQTACFMGWGCNACLWKDFLPRDVPTLLAPSAKARLAFKQHKCEGTARSSRSRLVHMACRNGL
jgi:hypothetical protein